LIASCIFNLYLSVDHFPSASKYTTGITKYIPPITKQKQMSLVPHGPNLFLLLSRISTEKDFMFVTCLPYSSTKRIFQLQAKTHSETI
jgi:hypothetical protein